MRIALDAMGGDYAPRATVEGAIRAAAEMDPSHRIQLVGDRASISAELERSLHSDADPAGDLRQRIDIIDAPEVIDMGDKPTTAVRSKPNSSMVVGLRMHRDGEADAFVSAGNTGAQMAASIMLLRLHPTITRPAIGTLFPTELRPVVVLDSGANVDCSAAELVQFARLGSVYAEAILGRAHPAVALLSIGEEPEKGNAVVKDANQLLSASGLNFLGNVEGRDLPFGKSERGPIDVVVCDGFVGNIILKLYEAMAPMVLSRLGRALGLDREKMSTALSDLDYSEYGGAPLLGVRGVSIIAHGKSSARAIKNAVLVAARAVQSRVSDQIGRSLAAASGGAA